MTKVSDERRTDRELSDMIQSLLNHGEAGYTYVKIDAHLSALRELQSLRAAPSNPVISDGWQRAETAEAQVLRLTEENEALRKALTEIECAETTNDYGQPMSYAGAYYRSLASQALKENAL